MFFIFIAVGFKMSNSMLMISSQFSKEYWTLERCVVQQYLIVYLCVTVDVLPCVCV